jgi:large subunit ribosomal protein L4
MEVSVKSATGQNVGTIQLDERVFGIEPNQAVLHQAVVAYQANMRQGTAATKTRGMVQSSGKKPWRQKGTGRARQGMVSAPHWRGGGVVFGPHPRSYHQRLPRKMRRLALRSALSEKMSSGGIMVVDGLGATEGRTKELLTTLSALETRGRAVIVLAEADAMLRRASGNLGDVRVVLPNGLNLLEVIQAGVVILHRDAVAPLSQLLLGEVTDAAVA